MPPRGTGVGSVGKYQDGQPEDPPILQSDSPPDSPPDIADTGPDSSTGQRSELEAHAEALQALEQAKAIIASGCVRLLALPIEGLRDVANACSVSYLDDLKPA